MSNSSLLLHPTTMDELARYYVDTYGPQALQRVHTRTSAAAVAARLLEVGWQPAVVSAVLTDWWNHHG